MQPSVLGNALADRGDGGQCNMPRIPTGRYPFFSRTLKVVLDANGYADVDLEAERDLLIIGLSVRGAAFIDATYCNTKYLDHSATIAWGPCCERKPVFLVGVRENKELHFHLSGGTPAATARITVYGFQGSGCCG
jgi:hypothetical protein